MQLLSEGGVTPRKGGPKEGWPEGGFTQLSTQQRDPRLHQDARFMYGYDYTYRKAANFQR